MKHELTNLYQKTFNYYLSYTYKNNRPSETRIAHGGFFTFSKNLSMILVVGMQQSSIIF